MVSVIRIMSFKTHPLKLPINHVKSDYGPLMIRFLDFENALRSESLKMRLLI